MNASSLGLTPAPVTDFSPWENPTAQPLVEFRNVSKFFGDFRAVDQLSLKIYVREFFALLGPSGCGKTTLLRMLAGFESPSSGQILLDGHDISTMPVNKRPINMMFQSYALFPHMDVWSNIAFGLKEERRPKNEVKAQVEKMLALVQLEDFAYRKPHQLSGGQRQRVALARSLAKSPRVLLLDEPLAALDKKLREETQFELMGIQEDLGITFLIVTHDQQEAMTVASRIGLMRGGQLEQVDPPGQIYEYPRTAFTADFIGDINLLPLGESHLEAGVAESQVAGHTIKLLVSDLPSGSGALQLAIRPERLTLALERPSDGTNAVPGVIEDIAYTGAVSTYHVALSNGATLKCQMANHSRVSPLRLTWESPVWVMWDRDAGVLVR